MRTDVSQQTIFGSQFFNFDSETSRIRMSDNFWVFWAFAIPITALVVLTSYAFRKRGKMIARLRGQISRLPSHFLGEK
jgi:hypothetical protein